MRKNIFCIALSVMLLALCFAAQAQQPKKIPRIGFLTLIPNPDPLELIFLQGLRDLGSMRDETSPSNTVELQARCRVSLSWPRSWSR